MPVIVVFSVLTAIGYWRQVSPVSEAAKSLVDIRTVAPGTCPPPPMLPSSVPSHTKSFVGQAAKAAKTAWLIESNLANYTGEEISDEQLNKTYKLGRRWYSKHMTTHGQVLQVRAALPSGRHIGQVSSQTFKGRAVHLQLGETALSLSCSGLFMRIATLCT